MSQEPISFELSADQKKAMESLSGSKTAKIGGHIKDGKLVVEFLAWNCAFNAWNCAFAPPPSKSVEDKQ